MIFCCCRRGMLSCFASKMCCVLFFVCAISRCNQLSNQPTNDGKKKSPDSEQTATPASSSCSSRSRSTAVGKLFTEHFLIFLIFFIGEHSGSDPFCVPFHSVLVLHRTCGTYYCPGRHPHPTRYTGLPASWKIGETGGERHRNEERWATISWGANLIISTLGCRLEKRCV